jgi:predicted DsbA family dithiol-disulfide isomerase
MSDILKVDLWSDSACPWCYVGKRRFEEGVRRYHERGGNRTVQVEYHSFELAPDTPVDFQGSEVDFLAGYKGIPVARRYGISGVPFFAIDQRYGVSGAQDPSLFARALAQSADESQVQT